MGTAWPSPSATALHTSPPARHGASSSADAAAYGDCCSLCASASDLALSAWIARTLAGYGSRKAPPHVEPTTADEQNRFGPQFDCCM